MRWTPDATRRPDWFSRIARHLGIAEPRSTQRRRERGSERPPTPAPGIPDDDNAVDTGGLERVLRTLNPTHRAVIVRAYYDRLTTTEIADQTGIPEEMVKSRLHHGVAELRAACREIEPTDPNHR